MDPFSARAVGGAYDAVADEYAVSFGEDLARLELDRSILDRVAALIERAGVVLDVGCGPGQVSAYLLAKQVQTLGVDISPRMLAVARRRVADGDFVGGDVRSLPLRSAALAGVVAYYSLQHVARAELGVALAELRRVLNPGGVLATAIHLGEGEIVTEEFLGHHVEPTGGTFYLRDEFLAAVEDASFDVDVAEERGPLPHEHTSQRLYVIARAT